MLPLLTFFGAALLAITLVLCFRVMLAAMTRAVERRHRAMEEILDGITIADLVRRREQTSLSAASGTVA